MKDFEYFKHALNGRYEMAKKTAEETHELFREAANESLNELCHNMAWYANTAMKANVQLQLWEQVKQALDEHDEDEQALVEATQELVGRYNREFRSCSLLNLKVDGHGIQELTKHEALAKFLEDLEGTVDYFVQD